MLTEHIVVEVARAAGLTGEIVFLEVTDSTNSELVRMAEDGAPEWSLVVADHQTAGRGRQGRAWVSAPGSSLLASVLIRATLSAVDAPLVSLAAAVALASACASSCGVAPMAKWPNDLVIGDRKLGGILAESRVEGELLLFAVIGTGVNVLQKAVDFPSDLRSRATSIAMEGGRPDVSRLLGDYLASLKAIFDLPREDFRSEVLRAYRERSATLSRRVRARTLSGAVVQGIAAQIGDSGELVVESPSGRERVMFGEVVHLE